MKQSISYQSISIFFIKFSLDLLSFISKAREFRGLKFLKQHYQNANLEIKDIIW